MRKTTAALFLFGTVPFVGAGCSSGVRVGGEDGVAYRGRLFSDGKIIAMETSSGGDVDEDEDEVADEFALDDVEADADEPADEEVEEQAQAELDE